MIDFIFVPQGVEYKTFLSQFSSPNLRKIPIIPIPLGSVNLISFLQNWAKKQKNLESKKGLLIGLGGSISHELKVGEITLYESCLYQDKIYYCSDELKKIINSKVVKGLTVDRIITTHKEKKELAQKTQTQVIDMEAGIILQTIPEINLTVFRIISDDSHHNIPNIASAITPQGTLNIKILFREFIRNPQGAYYLIKGSLISLSQLKKLSKQLTILWSQD